MKDENDQDTIDIFEGEEDAERNICTRHQESKPAASV